MTTRNKELIGANFYQLILIFVCLEEQKKIEENSRSSENFIIMNRNIKYSVYTRVKDVVHFGLYEHFSRHETHVRD